MQIIKEYETGKGPARLVRCDCGTKFRTQPNAMIMKCPRCKKQESKSFDWRRF